MRGFLREVVDAFKILYDMTGVCLPVPVYHQLYAAGPVKNVLKRLKRMPARSSIKSFFFKLHSGTLPVKPWLQEKGPYVHPWTLNWR